MAWRRWLTYGAAVCLLGAGLSLFSLAEAGADGVSGTPSCTVLVTGSQPADGYGNDASSLPAPWGYTLGCSGIEAKYAYIFFTVGSETYEIGIAAYPGTTADPFDRTMAATDDGNSTWYRAWWSVDASPPYTNMIQTYSSSYTYTANAVHVTSSFGVATGCQLQHVYGYNSSSILGPVPTGPQVFTFDVLGGADDLIVSLNQDPDYSTPPP